MTGLELAKGFFEDYGREMLNQFKDIEQYLCVGFTGKGSECFGFDDEVSKDHDFEPGFTIFIPGEEFIDRQTEFKLERAYAKLPKEYKGFKRAMMSPVGGNRHGVKRISEYFKNEIGSENGDLTLEEWLTLDQNAFFEAIDGEIFFDNFGLVTEIRDKLKTFPEDIRKKRLAGNLLIMAQAGQYNYNRIIQHDEEAAAQMAVFEFVKSALEVIFLLNNKYKPYYKWSFRALRELPRLGTLEKTLEYLLITDNDIDKAEDKYFLIEDVASNIISELIDQDLTKANCGDLEKHAYSVNDMISDSEVRNLNILCTIK